MFETTSVFDVLAADDTDRRVASRKALALAHTRVDNHLGRYLTAAVTKEEFEARLAAVKDEFAGYVADACSECGHDHPERIATSLVDHYSDLRRWQPRGITAAPVMAPGGGPSVPPGIGGMAQAAPVPPPDPSMMGAPQPQVPSMMGPPAGGPPQAPDSGQTPAMEQAQNMMAQGPQAPQGPPQGGVGGMATMGPQAGGMAPAPVPPAPGAVPQDQSLMGGLPALQGSSSGRFLASDPSAQDDDSSKLVTCPECGGTKKQANGDQCPKCHGKGQVNNFGDSVLDHVAKLAETGSGNTDLGKPEPTMNKKRWTPQSVTEIDVPSKMHPTKRKDIIEPIKRENRDQPGHELVEIGEQTTERVDLPAAGDTDHGFYDGGQTKGEKSWQGGGKQVDPVTKTTL